MDKQLNYTISELANEFGITPRTIRYYEEVGLLQSHRESTNHQRHYNARDRARLKLILRGKRYGFTLNEIKEMIDLYDVDPTQGEQMKRTIAYGDKKIAEINEMVADLLEIKAELLEFREKFTTILSELDNKGKGEK